MSEAVGGSTVGTGGGGAPAPGGGPPDARSRVAGPAIALLVVAGVGMALQAIGIVARLLGISLLGAGLGEERPAALAILAGGLGIVLGVVGILVGLVVLFGALKMKALESYGLAMTAAILAMIPCLSPCCLLGLPAGIWALVVLLDQGVKREFR